MFKSERCKGMWWWDVSYEVVEKGCRGPLDTAFL